MSLKSLFKSVANSIREKDGTTDLIVAEDFPDRIKSLPIPFTFPFEDVEFGAAVPTIWEIKATSSDESLGGCTGNGFITSGVDAVVTVKAIPLSGGKFVRWISNGETVSTSSSYQFRPSGDTHLIAEFKTGGVN